MKLTCASTYALYSVVYLAQQKSTDPVASQKIAKARGIKDRFLLKVLKDLVPAKILKSIKGPHGGYQLARPADEITVLDIVEAVDGPIGGQVPWSEKNTPGLNNKLEAICDQGADAVRATLGKYHVSDLVARGGAAANNGDEKPASRRKKD